MVDAHEDEDLPSGAQSGRGHVCASHLIHPRRDDGSVGEQAVVPRMSRKTRSLAVRMSLILSAHAPCDNPRCGAG